MGLTAHEAAVVAGAKALHEAGVVGDRMSMAETVVSALAADPDVRSEVIFEAHCGFNGERLTSVAEAILAALGANR